MTAWFCQLRDAKGLKSGLYNPTVTLAETLPCQQKDCAAQFFTAARVFQNSKLTRMPGQVAATSPETRQNMPKHITTKCFLPFLTPSHAGSLEAHEKKMEVKMEESQLKHSARTRPHLRQSFGGLSATCQLFATIEAPMFSPNHRTSSGQRRPVPRKDTLGKIEIQKRDGGYLKGKPENMKKHNDNQTKHFWPLPTQSYLIPMCGISPREKKFQGFQGYVRCPEPFEYKFSCRNHPTSPETGQNMKRTITTKCFLLKRRWKKQREQ